MRRDRAAARNRPRTRPSKRLVSSRSQSELDTRSRPAPAIPSRDRLIVALDLPTLAAAEQVVTALSPIVSWFKVGAELFTSAGPAVVAMIQARGSRVFLDLKYHDIPNTVAQAVVAAARLRVGMLTLHVAGGRQMLEGAVAGLNRPEDSSDGGPRGSAKPWLLGVTMLTSVDDGETTAKVLDAALVAQQSGLDGVVASAREAAAIKHACGPGFLVVTPGIRPVGADPNDQQRVATPQSALRAGADYLVVGRPIVHAANPRHTLLEVLAEMEGVAQG